MELKRYKLSEVAKVEISSVDKKTKENETPVRLCNFTDVYHNWAITSDMASSFMEASANSSEIEKFTIKKGQVAFTKDSETRDDIGIPTYIADDFEDVILGYHCALITPDETKLCGKYLNAFMHSAYIQRYFELNATGSGMRYTLSLDTLESMPLLLPSLEEQRRIGEIFSSLDKKISINRAINQNLEALAKQLYDYWFVQFDFPNEEGWPYKSSGGTMVWNDALKRNIPEGWKVCSLAELGNFKNGINYSKDEIGDWIYKIVNVRNISSSSIFIDNSNLDELTLKRSNGDNYLVRESDILIARSGSPGATRLIRDIEDNIIYCGFIICYTLNDLDDKLILFYSIKQLEGVTKAQSNGSILSNISQEVLKQLLVSMPPTEIKQRFNENINTIFAAIQNSLREIEDLIKQRDKLLPLMMNGQVSLNSDLFHG